MTQQVDVVILSVPYCEPLPLVAPVLLASCLQNQGVSARGVDFNADFLKHFSDQPYYSELKNFLTIGHLIRPKFPPGTYRQVMSYVKRYLQKICSTYAPRYIGLSIFTSESLDFGMIMSYVIRRYFPDIRIIAGGKGLEVNDPSGCKHYESWINHNLADVIVVGDAEQEIVDTIKQDKKGVIFAPPQKKQDLDLVPLAQWNDYDLGIYSELSTQVDRPQQQEEPYLAITASKGCVRQCTFCDVANFWPDFIYRDPIKVAEEIIHNYQATGIKKFKFTDNLINGSISNYRVMNQLLVEKIPRTISYEGYAIFRGKNQMPEEDFALASEAGCVYWSVGVESGSERLRYEMKKKFDDQDLDWSVRMLYRYRIQQNWLLMVGYPSETEYDFQCTMDLLTRYRTLARDGSITIQVTPTFSLLNNSPLLNNPELAQKYGLDHIRDGGPMVQKFWTSKVFLDNDFPTRSRRWKTLMAHAQLMGYQFGPGMPIQKWKEEIDGLDKIYAQQKTKVIALHRV